MTRLFFAAVFALFVSSVAVAGVPKKGVGCWRSIPSQQKAAARMLAPQHVQIGDRTNYHGQRRGLVILAEFTDMEFKSGHNRQKYDDILNAPNYTTNEGFRGSVADYFRVQSGGLFELQFDVVGPFTTKNNYKYYGQNDSDGNDQRPDYMIVEMCHAADSVVNFADYDWDGDGEVDEVFVVYAGKGEADTGIDNYIWPHMWTLDEAGRILTLDGVKINTYACANELKSRGTINGIGTFCHEFSHCLGLPDFYDWTYSGLFGMDDFDIMSGGSYAGSGFCPVGYTAYEKMMCGWKEPVVLADEDVTVDSLRPMSENGDTYIIYNAANRDEYYMIENRQKTGWDRSYPARGLMITHVDFDKSVWFNNIPNCILTKKEARDYGLTCGNDHQRMTLFHADDDDDSSYWVSSGGYHTKSTITTDLYPYRTNDSLTVTSKPAAILYHKSVNGDKLMPAAVLDIHQNSDGTMSFKYRSGKHQPEVDAVSEVTAPQRRQTVYTPDGRVAGTSLESLRHGIFIVDGKKVIR